MTNEQIAALQKRKVMEETAIAINLAKDKMYYAVQTLNAGGLYKDAETLMNMIYRLEKFQSEYVHTAEEEA